MKRTYSIIGLIGGLVVILLGFLVLTGAFGGQTDTAGGASYEYSSGYAQFGGDFYSYAVNNAQEAASAGRTTARNLHEIAKLLKGFCGIQLMAFGLFMVCLFGSKLEKTKSKPETPVPDSEERFFSAESETAPAESEETPAEPEEAPGKTEEASAEPEQA